MASHKFFLASALLLAQLIATTQACTCLFQDFESAFYAEEKRGRPFTRARVLYSFVRNQKAPFGEREYILSVEKVYSGCVKKTPYLQRATSYVQSATCGLSLTTGKTYILPLNKKGISTPVNLCQTAVETSRLTAGQKRFLDTRYLCCGLTTCRCANSMRVNCFVAPCRFAKPPCTEATKCVDNYCGGCNADWLNSQGKPACTGKPKLSSVKA